jgi:regulator of Ty1 transposition protein 103
LSPPLKSTIESADQEYEKQTDQSSSVPSAPVYAARLNGLLKTLANAESAVAECVKAREGLLSGLEKMLDQHKSALETDKAAMSRIASRKDEIEEKKQQIELAIMRTLGPAERNGPPTNGEESNSHQEPDRPEMEALTPPSLEVEPLTPDDAAPDQDEEKGQDENATPAEASAAQQETSSHAFAVSANGSNKRRRVDDSDEFPDLGTDDGIDADVADMLKEKSAE